jgi:hypothetical protein
MDCIEIAVIEVKEVDKITTRHLMMALGYSSIAHKCYLATTAEIREEDKGDASHLGVGLIKIYDTKKNARGDCIA